MSEKEGKSKLLLAYANYFGVAIGMISLVISLVKNDVQTNSLIAIVFLGCALLLSMAFSAYVNKFENKLIIEKAELRNDLKNAKDDLQLSEDRSTEKILEYENTIVDLSERLEHASSK